MNQASRPGIVVGLAAEARIAARFGYPVETGGGTSAGAKAAAGRLVDAGATALISFGLAGGLDPALRPGEVIVPGAVLSDGVPRPAHRSLADQSLAHRSLADQSLAHRSLADQSLAERFGGLTAHTILAGRDIAATAAAKRRIHLLTRAHAIDLESGAVAATAAAQGLPFVVVRAICDPAERDLPPAALLALGPDGAIGPWRVLRSVLGNPRQIAALLALARDARTARRALLRLATRDFSDPTRG